MLARCARIASTTSRLPIIHTRTFLTGDQQNAAVAQVTGLIDALANAKPPVPSTPPVGTAYGPPKHPSKKSGNPLDDKVIKSYAEKPPLYSLYCQSTRNNTITTLMDNESHPIVFHSGGTCGFKKVNRSSYEAGYQCAVRMFKTIEQLRNKKRLQIALYFKGFGQGRDAMQKALMTSEGDRVRELVVSITDRTPIKIGGTRAKKARRL
ncbi:hypothetical protein C0993_004072 [Termitomyces sp. T159_Od127]|nr:hypothetical protein C0993_004072 [Termitomyces sp. T159_Od127]